MNFISETFSDLLHIFSMYEKLLHNKENKLNFLILFFIKNQFTISQILNMKNKDYTMLEEQRTLSILKPDAISRRLIGKIVTRFEDADLRVIAMRFIKLTRENAELFYLIHKTRPFFKDLVEFMISGPILVQVLQGVDAIQKNRDLMGNTDPRKASPGTIRGDLASSIESNLVHGSDSRETAAFEISFFFPEIEILEFSC